MRRLAVFALCLLPISCGYHLVDKGHGVVPADVQVMRIMGAGDHARLLRNWQDFLRDHAEYRVISAAAEGKADGEIRIGRLSESLTPITFDASGIVTVDRMTLSGELSLWRNDGRIWSSGAISVSEDVDVIGGATAIESAKARIRSDLESQWMHQAWIRISSGF